MTFKPSTYQQNVFNFISNGRGNAVIEAVAGSGKTTTIIQALKLLPKNSSVLFLAFNKSVVMELKSKVPRSVEVSTYHSVGFRALRFALRGRRINVDSNKTNSILRTLTFENKQEFGVYAGPIMKLVGLAKSHGVGILDNALSLDDIAEHHDLHNRYPEALKFDKLKAYVTTVLSKSANETSRIDFDDMIYMPMKLNASFKRYDYVFIDEAQDTSHVQREMLKGMLKYRGRLIAVGDSSQAIYGFRGADSNSMNAIAEEFNATRLPLSISYRCAKLIVKEAQRVNDQIIAFDGNEDGCVYEKVNYTPEDFRQSDAIICRNTAPLINMAFALIAKGVQPNVLGRDIGKGLVSLCEKWKRVTQIDQLTNKLNEMYTNALSKANNDETKVTALADQIETINIFAEQCPDNRVSTLVSIINNFFSETPDNRITLCTVHKSKGLEWSRVYLLEPSKFQPSWVRLEWQQVQERNIEYVAITRAKNELVYIDLDCWA